MQNANIEFIAFDAGDVIATSGLVYVTYYDPLYGVSDKLYFDSFLVSNIGLAEDIYGRDTLTNYPGKTLGIVPNFTSVYDYFDTRFYTFDSATVSGDDYTLYVSWSSAEPTGTHLTTEDAIVGWIFSHAK